MNRYSFILYLILLIFLFCLPVQVFSHAMIEETFPQAKEEVGTEKEIDTKEEEVSIFNINKLITVVKAIETMTLIGLAGFYFFIHWILGEKTPPQLQNPLTPKMEISFYISVSIIFMMTSFSQLFLLTYSFMASPFSLVVFLNIFSTIAFTLMGLFIWIRPLIVCILIFVIRRKYPKWTHLIVLSSIILTFSLTGHAVVYHSILSHFIHLSAAAIWCGGLTGFIIYTFSREPSYLKLIFIQRCITRFSSYALVMFMIVIFSGIIISFTYLHSWDMIVSTTYGNLLIWKVALTSVIFLIASFHRFIWLPSLYKIEQQQDKINQLKKFVYILRLEIVILWIIVIIAGTLSTTHLPENHTPNDVNRHEDHQH
ncbi:CopD family protein [Alkalihalobacillus sp. APA_J-10(15)]|nr:CopD family protein [Halalkalibacter sp. APA_J-10(15)]